MVVCNTQKNGSMLFLYFADCRFNKVHPDWPKLIIEVAFHRSENSSEWFAEVSWSPFNGTIKNVVIKEKKNKSSCDKINGEKFAGCFPPKVLRSIRKEPFTGEC